MLAEHRPGYLTRVLERSAQLCRLSSDMSRLSEASWFKNVFIGGLYFRYVALKNAQKRRTSSTSLRRLSGFKIKQVNEVRITRKIMNEIVIRPAIDAVAQLLVVQWHGACVEPLKISNLRFSSDPRLNVTVLSLK